MATEPWERRDEKRRNKRKMRVTGRSLFTIEAILAKRREKAMGKCKKCGKTSCKCKRY
jgi:hypothetical protein